MGNYCGGTPQRPVTTMTNRPRIGYDFQKTTIHSGRFGEVLFSRKREQQYNFMMSVKHDGALQQITVDMVVLKELVDCVLFPNYDMRFQNKTVIDIFDMADHSQVLVQAFHRKTGQQFSVKFYPFTSYQDYAFKKGLYEIFLHGLLGNFARGIVNLVDYFVVDRSQQKALVFLYEPVETSLANIIEFRNRAGQPWTEAEQQYIMHSILAGYETLNRKNIYHRDLRPSRIYYSKIRKQYLIGNLEEARLCMAVDLQRDALLTPRGVPFFNSENVNEILRRNDRTGHYSAFQNDYIFLKKIALYIANTSYEDVHDSISNVVLRGIYDRLHTLLPIQEVLGPIRHIDFKIEESGIAEAVNSHLAETNTRVNRTLLLQALYYMHHNEQYSRLAHQHIEQNIELGRPLLNAEIFYRLGEYYASSGANSEDYFINAMRLFIRRSIYNRRMGFIGRSVESLREAKKCYDYVQEFNYKIMYLGQMAVVKANLGALLEARQIILEAMTQAATRGIPPLQELDLLLDKGEVCIFDNDVDNCQKHMKFGLMLCEDRTYFNDLRQQGEYKARFLTLMGISYVGESTGKDTFIVMQTGILDNRAKHLAKAESFLLSALEMSQVSPAKNIELATILYYLGTIFQLRGDFYQAKKSFVRALEFRLSYKDQISPPLIAQVFYKVATCCRLLNDLTEAEKHYLSALRILSVVPDLRQEALICQAYLGITMIKQGRVEDGGREYNLAVQGMGGQVPGQIAIDFQQAQLQGQPLAASQAMLRNTTRLPPGVLSSQHTNLAGGLGTSIIQTVTEVVAPPIPTTVSLATPMMPMGGSVAPMMGQPMIPPFGIGAPSPPPMTAPALPPPPAGFAQLANILQGNPQPPAFPPMQAGFPPPPGGMGMPGNMFESRGPLMESRVVRQPPIKRTISDPITLVPIVENLNNMPPPPMGGPSGFGAQPQPFSNSPPPSQMFNPQPAGTFGGPPSGIGAFPPPSMGVIEQTSNIYQAPTFSAPPPPPQMIYNLPPEGATRPPAFVPPPLANPTHEAPVPMPPPGFFESLMGSTPGSQPLVQSNIGASGVRQTEIDIVQNRDAAGSHRTVTITLPNQPAPNNPSEVIINLDNPQPSSTIYGSSSNIRASGFRPPAIVLPPATTGSNLYQPVSLENIGGSNVFPNNNPASRNVIPLNSNGALASSSQIRNDL